MYIKVVKKLWGEERWIVNNDQYCGKMLIMQPKFRSSFHWHKIKHETFFLVSGAVMLELDKPHTEDGHWHVMWPGDIQELPTGTKHRFSAIMPSVVMEFSTHHKDSDSYRDTESGAITIDDLPDSVKEVYDDSIKKRWQ